MFREFVRVPLAVRVADTWETLDRDAEEVWGAKMACEDGLRVLTTALSVMVTEPGIVLTTVSVVAASNAHSQADRMPNVPYAEV